MTQLRALAIRQPWAWAIANGFKDIENRDWPTKFRGKFLIHASAGVTAREYAEVVRFFMAADRKAYLAMPRFDAVERGGIIGVAEITDCVEEHRSKWFFGDYGFVIRNAKPLPFYPCKGQLGFFTRDWPDSIVEAA